MKAHIVSELGERVLREIIEGHDNRIKVRDILGDIVDIHIESEKIGKLVEYARIRDRGYVVLDEEYDSIFTESSLVVTSDIDGNCYLDIPADIGEYLMKHRETASPLIYKLLSGEKKYRPVYNNREYIRRLITEGKNIELKLNIISSKHTVETYLREDIGEVITVVRLEYNHIYDKFDAMGHGEPVIYKASDISRVIDSGLEITDIERVMKDNNKRLEEAIEKVKETGVNSRVTEFSKDINELGEKAIERGYNDGTVYVRDIVRAIMVEERKRENGISVHKQSRYM